ncbi:MAG: hypothetical protein ACODAD_00295 [Planctomycetota bacterium]
MHGTPFQLEYPVRHRYKVITAITLLLLATPFWNTASAHDRKPPRRGKVIIIRGAFTVFSLGMNELGEKLSEHGLDVEVVADITARRAASKLRSEFERNENLGPIVFIGHSRGAELGPKQASYLQRHHIPVKLVVMVDAVHRTVIPENVEKCVNLYHNGTLGIVHGVPARPESPETKMLNVDIDRLRSRSRAGSINHFNIDSSPWIHDLIIAQVLKACPTADSISQSELARHSSSPIDQNNIHITIRKRSSSGLVYPTRIVTGLWAASGQSSMMSGSRPSKSTNATRTPRSPTHPSASRARDKKPAIASDKTKGSQSPWSLGTAIELHELSKPRTVQPRTVQRPETGKTEQPEMPEQTEPMPRQSQKSPKTPTYSPDSKRANTDAPNRSSAAAEDSASNTDSSAASTSTSTSTSASTSASEPKAKADSTRQERDTPKKTPPVQFKLSG